MINKIEIQTSNKKHKTDIALLVDKKEFLEELVNLRGKWHITELYQSPLTPQMLKQLLNIDKAPTFELWDELKKWQEFNDDIDELLNNFNRGKNFKKAVIYALTTGLVPEGVYKSCYFDIVAVNQARDTIKPERYQYVIVMSPRTQQNELKEAHKEFKQYIKEKIKYEAKQKSMTFTEKVRDSLDSSGIYELLAKIRKTPKINGKHKDKLDATLEYVSSPEFTNRMRKELDKLYAKLSEIPPTSDNISDFFSDGNLLVPYYRGRVYKTADIDKFGTKTDIDRIREWYWIRNQKYFNGEAPEQLSYPKVLDEWLNTCPFYKDGKPHDFSDSECPKCTFFEKKIRKDKKVKEGGGSYNHIEKALDTYASLLNNS